MKEDEGQTKEVKANPYNKEKYWHKEEDMPKTFRSADEGPADANTDISTGFNYATNSNVNPCLLYTSPSPRDGLLSRMPSSA